MKTLLLKLGGSIITKKHASEPVLDKQNLSRIASEIAAVLDKNFNLVVVHGAGSYGHPIASQYNLANGLTGENTVAMAKCQALVNELNSLVCLELSSKGIPAYPFQISSSSISSSKQLKDIDSTLLQKLLNKNVVPVLFGTPAYDDKQGFSIISGDQIISLLSSQLYPKKVIFATNVDGIFDKNPHQPDAQLLKSLTASQLKQLEPDSSKDIDVTEGMKGKIAHILEMNNVTCHVINGNVAGNIQKALSDDESFGTVITL